MTARIIPKKNKDDLYRYLFTEGVLVCKKDRLGTWIGKLGSKKFTMPNNHVMYLMRSMLSRGLIKEQFAWRHFYWYLNDEGIAHLREYLSLSETVVPDTLKKSAKSEPMIREAGGGEGRGRGGRGAGRGRGSFGGRGRGFGQDRDAYRGRGRGAAAPATSE